MLYVKMPLKLAKMAAAAVDKTSVLIIGGIYGNSNNDEHSGFTYINSVYKLDFS